MSGEISTIRKSFAETVNEIKELEKQKKEVVPKPIEEETEIIEIISTDYKEALAELRRLHLVKRLAKK